MPTLLIDDADILRMKPIDLEKIYPSTEKSSNHTMIDIFFDKDRKLKRHADGTRLIKQFANPIYSSLREKSITKD